MRVFQSRYSCRNYTDKKISEDDLRQILEAARLSPSSLGLEPWKFFVVQDKTKLKELSKIANEQLHVAKASAVIIIASRLDFVEYFEPKLRGRNMSEADIKMRLDTYLPFLKAMNGEQKIGYAREQAHIALASILYAANAINIGSCAIGGFDKNKLDKWLFANSPSIERDKLKSSLMISLGYSNDKQIPAKTRFEFDEVVKFL